MTADQRAELEDMASSLAIALTADDFGLDFDGRLDALLAYGTITRILERADVEAEHAEALAQAADPGWVSLATAAKILGKSRRQVRRLAAAGILGAERRGRGYRFPADRLLADNFAAVDCESGHVADITPSHSTMTPGTPEA